MRPKKRIPWSMILFAGAAFVPMYLVPDCMINLSETEAEWREYNDVQLSFPSNGAASLSSHAAPPISDFPELQVSAEVQAGPCPCPFAVFPPALGESISGESPMAATSFHSSVLVENGHASPESQIIVPAISRSPVMDKLMPQKAQSRSLSSVRDTQIENAREVERLLWDKGYRQPHLVIAILANGWHESRWNAGTVYKEKNGTTSRGFFQLTNGALTIEGNVRQLTEKAPYAARITKWYSDAKRLNWDAGEAAYYFAARVEICARRFWNERKETAERWWSLMEEAAQKEEVK